MTIRPHPARLFKPAAQTFDYPTNLIGTTADGLTTVYYDPSLGTSGRSMADALLGAAPKAYAECIAWFGAVGQHVNLIVAPLSNSGTGDGGAYHYSCTWATGSDLYIDYAAGNLPFEIALFVAELSEAFMGESIGWNCGGSGGEALSRAMAMMASNAPLPSLFFTAPIWDQSGRPNWVDQDQGSDQDGPSIGCGMVYLSWLMARGFSAAHITQTGEPNNTLASNYKAVTGKETAWADFMAGVNALGAPITNDDPFGGIAANPQPIPAPTPQPPQPPPAPPPGPPIPTPQPPSPPVPPTPPTPPVPPAPPVPPSPPPVPSPAVTKIQAIIALTALVKASTLPD